MPYSEEWKLQHFYQMSSTKAKEVAKVWISIELNLLEEKRMWQNLSSNIATQHKDLSGDLQITLQEMIDMISSSTQEETIGDDIIHEEARGDDIVHKETRGDDIVHEETIGDDIVQEETRGDDWFN